MVVAEPMPRSGDAVTRLPIRARPGARRDDVAWDPWRSVWVISVTAPAEGGAANRALLELVADRLGLDRNQVTFERAGSSRSKRLVILGLSSDEVRARLGRPA